MEMHESVREDVKNRMSFDAFKAIRIDRQWARIALSNRNSVPQHEVGTIEGIHDEAGARVFRFVAQSVMHPRTVSFPVNELDV